MNNETTSSSVASIAARGMRDPQSLTHKEIRQVCASALTQKQGLFAHLRAAFSRSK